MTRTATVILGIAGVLFSVGCSPRVEAPRDGTGSEMASRAALQQRSIEKAAEAHRKETSGSKREPLLTVPPTSPDPRP